MLKRKIILFIMSVCIAHAPLALTDYEEINVSILSLGLPLESFDTLWPHYCKPGWAKDYDGNLLDTSEIVKLSLEAGFMLGEFEDGKTRLRRGPKCAALLDYYLDGKESEEISKFIQRDKLIVEKYGFSSIDLLLFGQNTFASYSTYNWNDDDVRFLGRMIERFEAQKIFTVNKETKTDGLKRENGVVIEIEVAPYTAYSLTTTEKYKQAHELLKKNHDQSR